MTKDEILDFIILNGVENDLFSLKDFLLDNKITNNLSSEQTHDLIEEIIHKGKTIGYLTRPTKEQYVSLTREALLIKSKGGFINNNKSIEEKENLELEKLNVDLELAKQTLKEFPRTKWFARVGFIIAIVLALKELYILLEPLLFQ